MREAPRGEGEVGPRAGAGVPREIRLQRFKTTRAAFFSAWPWFVTLVVLASLNLGASVLLRENPALIPWFGGLNLVIALGGLFAQSRQNAKPQPEFLLRVSGDRVEVSDSQGQVLWGSRRRGLQVKRENYVARSRWGSFRYPVLGLVPAAPEGVASVAVSSTATLYLVSFHGQGGGSARASVTPHYVALVPEELERVAQELS